ncbi:hypothetical protein EWU23_00245 [Cytophagaceae bacterium 50C-KIRBA]|uniref:Apea-like HEPN domain-containing protein n=1 Tax=Aquirufa beregesia TaxID=2516556 RepID=A0ABX0EVW8_9BACT|nr:hypothetical protein [Aquirufa beregesia]NGZ42899.1 hypothetical protein [Aquirufa beregesia]
MEDKIKALKEKFKHLKIDKIEEEDPFTQEGEVPVIDTYYIISNFHGNKNISVTVSSESKLELLDKFLSNESVILDEYLGVKYQDKYEIVLSSISNHYMGPSSKKQKFEIILNYFKNELSIHLESNVENTPASDLYSLLYRFGSGKRNWIITIENFKRTSPDGLNNDLRNILNSVLFDFEYSFNLAYEPIELNSLNKRIPRLKRPALEVPAHPINFTYKKYIPELIQYYHLSEKVDYIPFKYLCYFHILEYFSDKSAYFVVAAQVKQLLLKPDFHLKTDNYIEQAINIFKKENEKHLTDKIKLTRVLQQFVNMHEFREYLDATKLLDHFQKEQIFNCYKPLKIPLLDFTNEVTFFQSLTNRVYAMRCSIVHSNPDFDETKAVPFVHTSENVISLNIEMALVYEISRNIVVKSSDTR